MWDKQCNEALQTSYSINHLHPVYTSILPIPPSPYFHFSNPSFPVLPIPHSHTPIPNLSHSPFSILPFRILPITHSPYSIPHSPHQVDSHSLFLHVLDAHDVSPYRTPHGIGDPFVYSAIEFVGIGILLPLRRHLGPFHCSLSLYLHNLGGGKGVCGGGGGN